MIIYDLKNCSTTKFPFSKVSHDNAKLICEAMGGFLAEVPFGPRLNYWIVGKLLEKNDKFNEGGLLFELYVGY